jgi:hypothetical protein
MEFVKGLPAKLARFTRVHDHALSYKQGGIYGPDDTDFRPGGMGVIGSLEKERALAVGCPVNTV